MGEIVGASRYETDTSGLVNILKSYSLLYSKRDYPFLIREAFQHIVDKIASKEKLLLPPERLGYKFEFSAI